MGDSYIDYDYEKVQNFIKDFEKELESISKIENSSESRKVHGSESEFE